MSQDKNKTGKQTTVSKADSAIPHPHDTIFKKAMQEPRVAKSFIETHIPDDIKRLIDIDTLKLEKDTFIDDDFKTYACDVLFSARIAGRDGYVMILLEHQSKPDYWMAFRLMRYMINICSSYIKEHKNVKYLPLIYPVVLYNGLQKYKVPLSFWDLFEEKDKAKQAWMGNYQLVNVHDIPDNVFIKMGWSGALEYAMKYYYDKDKIEIMRKAGKLGLITALLKAGDKGIEYLSYLLSYLLNDVDKDDNIKIKNIIKNYANEEQGEKFMGSLAKHWEEIGIEKGKAEGKAEGKAAGIIETTRNTARNMIIEGDDIQKVMRCTHLSEEEVKEIERQIKGDAQNPPANDVKIEK